MEIRWCWTALVLLTVVSRTAVTHDMSSDSISISSSSSSSSSTLSSSTSSKRNSQSSKLVGAADDTMAQQPPDQPVSDGHATKPVIKSNYNLDEIIASTEAIASKTVKKYLQKQTKKHRKKYTSASIDEHPPTRDAPAESESDKPHSRQKRLIWVTDDGRLALPPGTSLTIAPTIALPFVRYPPTGFLSNISISLPVTIDFDKLGLTDNQNPLGVLPPLLARSMGRAAGSILADYVSDYMRTRRRKRSVPASASFDAGHQGNAANFKIFTNSIDGDDAPTEERTPELPEEHKHAFHGGERALLYSVVEDFIANFGMDGRACMLRAICEVHSKPMEKFGLIGEMLKLFFTASLSPYSEHLDEYVSAENIGKGKDGPGECFPYYKDCPKSLFRLANNYQQQHQRYKPSPESMSTASEAMYEEVYENSLDDIERNIRSARNRESSHSSVESKEETIVQLDGGVSKLAM